MVVINQSDSTDFHFQFHTSLTLTTLSLNTFLLWLLWSSAHDGPWGVVSAQKAAFQRLPKNRFLCWSRGTATTTI